ncbi:alpha/beta hydrolase [Mycobacterium riyadhense]|uniref:Alpha/beta hydrolase n=1 Tax=Mycobacterium riyadhense TaxID=486698 RepID=A0A1X2D9E4_9MYCO|nr:alpha/beta hydrolase [Mycobacterium riyadhense]MCV7147687.1 hypothetical protein [Mycobacterium riyadhense]ORW84772.1 hypothetical protein AWC22_12795 [Mycobacterium riyadhense]
MQLRYISIPALIAEAGGDPWAINQSLQAGRPAQIADLAEAFHAAGRCTAESNAAFEDARRRFDAAWNRENGEHPINDSAEVQRVTASLGAQSLQLPKIGVDLENIAAALAEAQRTAAGQIATLEGQLQQIDNQLGQALELEKVPHLTAADRSALDALISSLEQHAIDDTASALGQLKSIRAGYAGYLERSLATLRTDGYDPAAIQGLDAPQSPVKPEEQVQIPPPDTSAEDVHRWWTSLTPEERQRLLAEHPDRIGNLNGVPVSARSDANIAVMTQDLNRVRDIASRYGVSVDDALGNPAKYGLSASDITRYQNADQTKQGLDHDVGNNSLHPNPVYLFAYDPLAFGGKGRAAIAIGNPDTAKSTAVIVPGTSSSVKGGWLHDGHNDALNLYSQANLADPNNPTAVIAWMGYDAPNDFTDPRIATPMLARTGGATLAQDVNGLWVTHLGAGQHVTVLGHSYGSTTVADAFALGGMHANDAVLLGCPGTDLARSAASFHLDGGRVYVGAASTDPITMLGQLDGLSTYVNRNNIGGQLLGLTAGLGTDPVGDGFGSVRFRAEIPGSNGINPHDHSYYYHRGSEALHGMADIVSGHSDALASDGMLAQPRHQPSVKLNLPGLGSVGVDIPGTPASIDPECNRPPGSITDDHVFDDQHHH